VDHSTSLGFVALKPQDSIDMLRCYSMEYLEITATATYILGNHTRSAANPAGETGL